MKISRTKNNQLNQPAQPTNLVVENDDEMKPPPRHILQMSCGITCELLLDDASGQSVCVWSERPRCEVISSILREYPRWRDAILKAWAKRRTKNSRPIATPKILVISTPRSRDPLRILSVKN
jgi:hypothetical protein